MSQKTSWSACGPQKLKKITPVLVLQKSTCIRFKKLILKRFMVRSTTRTLITDKNDHSAFTAIIVPVYTRIRVLWQWE
jgi:hypothetical protein